jgi:predicted nuclease of predicted toxin-antitoxin system
MRILADESVDRQVVDRLRRDGYDVYYVAEMEPGISDEQVLHLANREADFLLTADKDFGELVFRRHRISCGVMLVRLAGLVPRRKAEIVAAAVRQHVEELPGAFSVITPGLFRIRRVRQ